MDSDLLYKGVDILHKQTLHTIVLLIEFAKLSLNSQRETQAQLQQRRNYLLEQTVNCLAWAQQFDPKGNDFDDLKLPNSLKKLQ